jgi:hypothetical protein
MKILHAGLALLAAAGLLLASGGEGQAQSTTPAGYEAWIVIKPEGNLFHVEPFCRASEDASLTYRLTARKAGRSGTSTSSQSGTVTVKANQAAVVSRLSLSVGPGDRYEFVLEIFLGGQKVAEATAASPLGV